MNEVFIVFNHPTFPYRPLFSDQNPSAHCKVRVVLGNICGRPYIW